MGLFGRKKLSEIDAASQFVLAMTKGVRQNWPRIAAELNQLLHLGKSIPDDQYTAFEFVLAVIATQIQALPNLLPPIRLFAFGNMSCDAYRHRSMVLIQEKL
jgi:hypothetical protein